MPYKYKRIKLKDGSTRDQHRLIMEAYLGRKLRPDEVIHHKNGVPRDNRIENLEILTRSEHTRLHMKGNEIPEWHKERLRQLYKGKPRRNFAKLTSQQVQEIKALRESGLTIRKISEMYGVAHSTICDLLSGKTLSYRTE